MNIKLREVILLYVSSESNHYWRWCWQNGNLSICQFATLARTARSVFLYLP